MLTLYDYLPSQNAWKIRLLLNQLERSYTQVFISIFEGEGRTPAYKAVNPTGAVPALELEDGTVIAESNAILVYLATGTRYLPSSAAAQARVLQWLFFESDYVQSSVATLRHWKMTGKDKQRSDELLNNKLAASEKVLKILDDRLANTTFLSGDEYTIADISVFAYVHAGADAGLDMNDFVHVQKWIEEVRAQPRFLDAVYPYSIDEYSGREL